MILNWAMTNLGGGMQNVSYDRGGNVLYSAPSKTTSGGLREWDFVWLAPFPLKGNHRA